MKSIKLALLAGAAVAVSVAAAQADDLDALKAQIETLNARVAAMETAPSVPAGYSLLAVSEGEIQETPGLPFTAQEAAGYGSKATIISVLPTADAPAGTTISWSGYARAGLVYSNAHAQADATGYYAGQNGWVKTNSRDVNDSDEDNGDIDVKARGQIRVKASTDTAVGEVGVDIRLRANFNGNGSGDVYSDVAWGYWSMTPEMTFGGGYADSLGKMGYGLDGACTCYYTDNSDAADFDPGKTTQMRLAYHSGPFSMAVALEDASIRGSGDDLSGKDKSNGDRLGASGEIKYSGDSFSGEISGVWRDVQDYDGDIKVDGETYDNVQLDLDAIWQVGAGVGFDLGDTANLSLAAATGGGPAYKTFEGQITSAVPYNQTWWGVSALASANLSDEFHAEIGVAYKNRNGDSVEFEDGADGAISSDGIDSEEWTVLGGIYYDPVDQLTIGLEGEWINNSASVTVYEDETNNGSNDYKYELDAENETFQVDLVSVWRF